MQKNICIDGFNLALQHGTGVATYAKNLANNISELNCEAWTLYGAPFPEKANELLKEVLFYDHLGGGGITKRGLAATVQYLKEAVGAPFGVKAARISMSGNVEVRRFDHRLPCTEQIFNAQNMFSIARAYFKRHNRFLTVEFKNPPDVMHWTYPLPLKVRGVPNVYTIHDLVPLRLPYTTLDNKRYYFRLIKRCLEEAESICTVSEKSLNDIDAMFGAHNARVVNTYQAVDSRISPNGDDGRASDEVNGIYGLEPQSYFLFFGAIEPKKNVGRLIEAFMSVPLGATLVIAGSMAWKSDEEMKLYSSLVAQRPDVKAKIRLLGYVPYPFLMSLIRCAKAVVFPSLYEGFGLPVLEAMQMGTPTLCSKEGSLPEIAGEASVFVNPYDTSSIAAGLRLLDNDADLRASLSVRGVKQSEKFNKQAYQKRLLDLYQIPAK